MRVDRRYVTLAALAAFLVCSASFAAEARAQNACTLASVDSIAPGFASYLRLAQLCPLQQLSNFSPSICYGDTVPLRTGALDDKLRAVLGVTCAFPNEGTLRCASSAVNVAGRVPSYLVWTGYYPVEDPKLRRCRKAVGKGAGKFAQAAIKTLGECTERALRSETGYGPPGPSCTDVLGSTQAAVASAEEKLRSAIDRKCSGPDRIVGTPDDFDPQDDLTFLEFCSSIPSCTHTMPGIPELGDCAICIARSATNETLTGAIALPLAPVPECMRMLGSRAVRLATDNLKRRATCENEIVRGTETACPDSTASHYIEIAEALFSPDELPGCTVLDPQDDLGFASTCPSVGTCAGIDVSETPGLLDCIRCVVTERMVFLVDTLFPGAGEENDPAKRACRLEIGDRFAAQNYALGKEKLDELENCESDIQCGIGAGPCPSLEQLTSLGYVRDAAASSVADACSGIDPQALGFATVCPAPYSCGSQETDSLGGMITCLTCLTDGVTDELNALYYPAP